MDNNKTIIDCSPQIKAGQKYNPNVIIIIIITNYLSIQRLQPVFKMFFHKRRFNVSLTSLS